MQSIGPGEARHWLLLRVSVGSDQRNDRSAALPQLAQNSKSVREEAHVEIIPEA